MAKELEDIWNELLQLHWEYLETEENMQKIEMRKRLEGKRRSLSRFWPSFLLCYSYNDRYNSVEYKIRYTIESKNGNKQRNDEFVVFI